MKNTLIKGLTLFFLTALALSSCKEKTASEKAQDKLEDAGKEIKKGLGEAKEDIKEAAEEVKKD